MMFVRGFTLTDDSRVSEMTASLVRTAGDPFAGAYNSSTATESDVRAERGSAMRVRRTSRITPRERNTSPKNCGLLVGLVGSPTPSCDATLAKLPSDAVRSRWPAVTNVVVAVYVGETRNVSRPAARPQ